MSLSRVRWIVALLPMVLGCGPRPATDGPNVLLLVIDTLRADRLSGYGSPRSTSPHLDRIAAEGAVFRQAIAPSSWSPPSHTTIVTGLRPYGHRVLEWGHAIPDDVPTLAERLGELGYDTALFSSHKSLARGVGRFPAGYDSLLTRSNEHDERVLDDAAAWVEDRTGPWFAHVILMTPHAPYTKYPAALDRGLYDDPAPDDDREFEFLESRFVGDGGIPASVALPPHRRAGYYRNRYDRAVRHVDTLVGRFLDRLREGAGERPTLLLVVSDHGEGFGERNSFAHEVWLDDHLVRVPLLVHLPGVVTAGRVESAPVELTDLVPTLLSLCESPAMDTHGRDLSLALASPSAPDDDDRFATGSFVAAGYRRFFVRSDRHKLQWDAVKAMYELFDLHRDPGERRNLLEGRAPADLPSGPVAALDSVLADRLDAYAAAMPQLESIEIPGEITEELRALGYVD